MTEDNIASFKELGLAPAVYKVINEVGYETPSPIQARSIPPLLEGRDLLGQAQTGTGENCGLRTASFESPRPEEKTPTDSGPHTHPRVGPAGLRGDPYLRPPSERVPGATGVRRESMSQELDSCIAASTP